MSIMDIIHLRSPLQIAHAVLGYASERRRVAQWADRVRSRDPLADGIIHERPRELARQLPI